MSESESIMDNVQMSVESEDIVSEITRKNSSNVRNRKKKKNTIRRFSTSTADTVRRISAVPDENKRIFKNKNGWTPELELSCKKIANESAINKWLHNKNALVLNSTMDKTTLAAAILSALTAGSGLTGFIATNYSDQAPWIPPTVAIVSFLLSLVATIILIVQRTYGFAKKIENHKKAEGKYQWLFFNIQSQLQQPLSSRQRGSVYFGWISHEYSVISNTEDIDDGVIASFYSTFEEGKVPGVDTLDRLEINEDEDTETYDEAAKVSVRQSSDTDENAAKNGLLKGVSYKKIDKTDKKIADNFRNEQDAKFMSIVSNIKCEKPQDGLLDYELRRGGQY